MGKRLPKSLEPTILNLIKESEILDLPEEQTIAYIANVTRHTISHSYYWKIKNSIKNDNILWVMNFGKEGYITEFRKRLFVFENMLTHVKRQYNMEISLPRQEQDRNYLKNLVDQITTLNTRITQLMMSSPMLAAIKTAMDPEFDILDLSRNDDYIKRVGQEIGERQNNIRLDYIHPRPESNPQSITETDGGRQEGGGETSEEEDSGEDPEEVLRRQKEKGIFFNPE